jgi:putative nucleotidyltransferase with HDIG domain
VVRDPTPVLPVIRALSKAVYTRAIYPPDHPRVEEGEEHVRKVLSSGLSRLGGDELTLLALDNELLFDDRPLRSHDLQLAPFVRTMKRRGVDRLTLAKGLREDECRALVDGLARCGEITSTPHVRVGRVYLRPGSDDGEPAAVAGVGATESLAGVDVAEESFVRFDSDPTGSVEHLDQMLWRLVEGLDQTSRRLLLLGPMKSFNQQLFVHSINVALLTLAQARALGIQDQALHDVGLAALFHDIGKLSLPPELLDKRDGLTEDEEEIMRLHPELGAAKLCALPEVPHLAVLVAYEHHLRWDGKRSFPVPSTPRSPNLASQLTAIADTYELVSAGRGLSGRAEDEATLGIWQELSGTYLDPFLVGSFVMMISEARDRVDADQRSSPTLPELGPR